MTPSRRRAINVATWRFTGPTADAASRRVRRSAAEGVRRPTCPEAWCSLARMSSAVPARRTSGLHHAADSAQLRNSSQTLRQTLAFKFNDLQTTLPFPVQRGVEVGFWMGEFAANDRRIPRSSTVSSQLYLDPLSLEGYVALGRSPKRSRPFTGDNLRSLGLTARHGMRTSSVPISCKAARPRRGLAAT